MPVVLMQKNKEDKTVRVSCEFLSGKLRDAVNLHSNILKAGGANVRKDEYELAFKSNPNGLSTVVAAIEFSSELSNELQQLILNTFCVAILPHAGTIDRIDMADMKTH